MISTLLAACGGGGDGGTVAKAVISSSGSSSSAAKAGTTGYVPAAPATGETLHADAATLRPLRNEALWVYRGTRNSGARKIVYASFRQTVSTPSGFSERISSPLEGASGVQGVSISGGTVMVQDSLALPAGAVAAGVVELRSPVRRDDQVTLIDQTGVALKDDLDGDRQTDHVDIASYSRVIGDEDVELPEIGRTLRALRVDVTTVSSLRLSSRGQADPARTVLVSSWYAPGIGLVRRAATVPSIDGIGPRDTDERLQYWDGIDRGLGLVPSAPVPVSGGTSGLGPWIEAPLSAVRNGDRAFVISATAGLPQQPQRGIVLSVLDKRGRVLNSVGHDDLGLDATSSPEIMALGDGAAIVLTEPGVYADPYLLENLKLVRFDAQGYRTTVQWLASGALPGTLKAASDGQTIWVTWIEPGLAEGSTRVMVQSFDAGARPLAIPQVLENRAAGAAPGGTAIAAAAGRALVTWRVPGIFGDDYRQALVGAAGPAAVATLQAGAMAPAVPTQPVPRVSDTLAALTWYAPLDRGASAAGGAAAARGVVLDGRAHARRATAGGADNEGLQLPAHDRQRSAMQADGASLLFSAAGSARLSADESAEDRYLDFAALTPSSGPLAAATVQLQRYRDRTPVASGDDAGPLALKHILAFDDRWLILGHDARRLTAAVLHKP